LLLLRELSGEPHRLAVADHDDPDPPTLLRCERLEHVVAAAHLVAADADEHIADLDPRARRHGARLDLGDQHAAVSDHAEELAQLLGQPHHHHAEVALARLERLGLGAVLVILILIRVVAALRLLLGRRRLVLILPHRAHRLRLL